MKNLTEMTERRQKELSFNDAAENNALTDEQRTEIAAWVIDNFDQPEIEDDMDLAIYTNSGTLLPDHLLRWFDSEWNTPTWVADGTQL